MSFNKIILYLPNPPEISKYEKLGEIKNLNIGEIDSIISKTSNHWRKIFNIFAKVSYELSDHSCATWQKYRDQLLLQKNEEITFKKNLSKKKNCIHIISGLEVCKNLKLDLKEYKKKDLIYFRENYFITPYFDYRQFPNKSIEVLVNLIKRNLK